MTMLREVRFIPIKHDREEGDGPTEAYFMDSGTANEYVIGSGSKTTEATAFLKDEGSGVFILDTDIAEEDRKLYAIASGEVLA